MNQRCDPIAARLASVSRELGRFACHLLKDFLQLCGSCAAYDRFDPIIVVQNSVAGTVEDCAAPLGAVDEHSALICRVCNTVDKAAGHHPVCKFCQSGMVHEHKNRELAHGASVAVCKYLENPPLLDREQFVFKHLFEFSVELSVDLSDQVTDVSFRAGAGHFEIFRSDNVDA